MKITVSRIPSEGLDQEITEKAEFFPVLADLIRHEGFSFTEPVKTQLHIMILADEVVAVEGRISTVLRLECGRCLETYEHRLKRKFKLGFVKSSAEKPAPDEEDLDIEIREEDIGTEYYTGDTIYLKHAIQEQVVMCLPQHPLCSEDCKGLCQVCGTNLNMAPCSCERVTGHPAFAALKSLKK